MPLATTAEDDSQVDAERDTTTAAPLSQDEYYELFQVFADTLEQVERNYVEPISRRELMEAAIEGLLGKLDPYSSYIAPEEISQFRTSVESRFGGVGIQIRWTNEDLTVVTPLVGTPAYLAGLQSEDRIVAIDGKSTAAIAAENPSVENRISQAVELLKGEPGSTVDVTFRHGNSPAKTVALTREVIRVETVLGDRRDESDSWDFMLDPEHKIGYIRITSFSRDTADDLRKAMVSLKEQGLQGLILDLRFDPGGLLTSAVEVSDMFVSNGRIVSTKGRNVTERAWDARHPDTFDGFPMAVLVNHLSASASEIVSACLQDHGRAVIIGERTWGKGSVQNVIELEDGKSALKLTTAGYVRPNGKNIHRSADATEEDEWGVTPDDNFLIRLSTDETRRMLSVRAERDILRKSHAPVLLAVADEAIEAVVEATERDESADGTPVSDDGDDDAAEAADDDTDAPTAKTETTVGDSEPAAEPATDETASDEPPPSAGAAEAAEPEADEKADEAEASDDDDAFVDRQLQAALDYLREKIAG
jgi:carboxyl-terminal processing protease